MSDNLNKHKILKSLYKKWEDGEEKTGFGRTVSNLGRSMSVIQIQNSTKIPIQKVKRYCDYLTSNNYIHIQKEESDNKNHFYIIQPEGKSAFLDNVFRNKFWFFNFDFWKFTLPFIIGLIGLLNSIFHWWDLSTT
jgi:hypothetical protein|tara:strand:- start:1000 stop:1404 length:405 start_codon:yes stop_codon:yes gene_type:complete